MDDRCEALVLGIGNVLWADEGFGVRAVEALHAAFAFPAGVVLQDGGTLGLNLLRARSPSRAPRAGVRRHRLRPCPGHAQGAARRRGAGVGPRPSSRRTRPASTTCSRWRSSTAAPRDASSHRRAAGRAVRFRRQPARRRCGRACPRPSRSRRGSWPPGASPARRARPAPPSSRSTRRRSRSTPTKRAAPPPPTPAASAIRGCSPPAPRRGRLSDVRRHPHAGRRAPRRGIAVVRRSRPPRAHRPGAGRRRSRRAAGSSRSRARARAHADRRGSRADRRRARRARGRARRRRPTSTRYFADLIDREPELPDHLKGTADDRSRCRSRPAPTPARIR